MENSRYALYFSGFLRVVLEKSRAGALFSCLLLMGGCSSLQLLNTINLNGMSVDTKEFTYGNLEEQKLDIYIPAQTAPNRPVVVFFYGGRWQSGSKEEYRFVGEALASRGLIAVIPDYRLFPSVEFPVFIQDGAEAVSWVMEHIDKFGGNSSQIYLMGHSAGGHIAAMLNLDERYLVSWQQHGEKIRGMIGLAGALDFKITDADIKQVFRAANSYEESQPITYVDGSEPEMLLLHGEDDTTLKFSNSLNLANKAERLGGRANFIKYEGMTHISILLALSDVPFLRDHRVLDDIESFIKCGQSLRIATAGCQQSPH